MNSSRNPVTPPSSTSEGIAWLENFDEWDRPTARLLLDALRIASEGELRAGLLNEIDDFAHSIPKPILILPVRDIADFRTPANRGKLLTVYEDFKPSDRYGPSPGSEAIAANILRDFTGIRFRNLDFLNPESSIAELRQNRCRSLVLVEDYSGSGTQAYNYIKTWLRNPTIRSWRSFGWFRVYVVYFAVSSAAAKRLRSGHTLDELHFVEPAAEFSSTRWTQEEVDAVIDLCLKYCEPRRLRRSEALGFRSNKGLFVTQHTVPNNLPAVLLQQKGPDGRDWAPFFPGRVFPASLQAKISGYRPREEFQADPALISDQRLAEALQGRIRKPERPYFTLLAYIAGRTHSDEVMAASLATSVTYIRRMTEALTEWGLIDSNRRVTDEGWSALHRARMRPRRVTFSLNENHEPYYPQQLRGAGDT